MMKTLFLQGYSILVIAIILNILAPKFNIATWFDFAEQITRLGLQKALSNLKIVDLLFLFVGYPLALAYSIKIPELLGWL